ncbi:hypothetical protein [Bacillus amyloliquefaciens]|uniref:hypothetical protein n=1 Tax=Bacillus amyloliquefaciens TaxID=1390 RepID=UPI002280178D|nr:hypothetical protein [Bacillus amyloliquefaciens]MCY7423488.1 hypothetical protein [Bacillus amyloliquefaciens]MEC0966095.1 hypothetical protein [Bacillus amyloliquefaciens]MEC1013006.1 hypothetical protein [Bacillus amyloliquefaciens]
MTTSNLPNLNEIQTLIALDERKLTDFIYQGAWPHDEDPADYFPATSIKAVRVG